MRGFVRGTRWGRLAFPGLPARLKGFLGDHQPAPIVLGATAATRKNSLAVLRFGRAIRRLDLLP